MIIDSVQIPIEYYRMERKKGEERQPLKGHLQSLGISSKTETSKFYRAGKRDPEERGVYFEMPSINRNSVRSEGEDRLFSRLQAKVLKLYEQGKENTAQEWLLYMKKSSIAQRSPESLEIEEFLLRSLLKALKKSEQADESKLTELVPSSPTNKQMMRNQMIGSPLRHSEVLEDVAPDEMVTMLKYQVVVLEKKVRQYEQKLAEHECALSKLEAKKKQTTGEGSDLMNQVIELTVARNKQRIDCETKILHIEALSSELTLSKKANAQLQQKQVRLQKQGVILEEQAAKCRQFLAFKELWKMSAEEGLTWRGMFKEQRVEKDKAEKKIKVLKEKNGQLLTYFNMSTVFNPDQEEQKHDLDRIIKEFKDWLQVVSVPKIQKEEPSAFSQDINCKLLRPNFYVFFQAFQNVILMEKNIINVQPIDYNFFPRMRAILDGMFNHLSLSGYREWCSFPEFVIGFLEKYDVDSASGKLQARRKPIQNQQKLTFLVNLFNTNFCSTWECDIFRNCLLENYFLDEVYFFLDCRNDLNGGVAVHHSLGAPDPISYVKLSKALKVVSGKLAAYEPFIIERVRNVLRSRKKVKHGESFVDKYFVLKLLLEVYLLERGKSQKVFDSSFSLKAKKSFINYEDYHYFMSSNFSFLSSFEIAALYRETYHCSEGHVTPKAIHYLCGVKGLFVPLLLEKRLAVNSHDKLQDMQMLDIQNSLSKLALSFEETGVESFMRVEGSLNAFLRGVESYRTSKSAFYFRSLEQKCRLIRAATFVNLQASLLTGDTLSAEDIAAQVETMHQLAHKSDQQVVGLSKFKERKAVAVEMLVRNFKIRIQQSISQFQKINQDEVENLKQRVLEK